MRKRFGLKYTVRSVTVFQAAMIKSLLLLPRKFACLLIRGYQNTLSPDHGPLKVLFPYGYCKFDPSCSMYTYQAIDRKGFLIGGWQGFVRIMRCNPCSKGGSDPVR